MSTRALHTLIYTPPSLTLSNTFPLSTILPPSLTFKPKTNTNPFLQFKFQPNPISSTPMKKLKLRGFRLTRKLLTSFKRLLRPRKKPTPLLTPLTRIISFAKQFRRTLSCSGYIQLGKEKQVEVVPRGHLAVYLGGGDDGEARRAVVPVVYVNHPLFGELLREAERVYGYNQAGRIVIPCGYSEFEKVKMRIAAWDHCHKGSQWRHGQELTHDWS